VEIRVQPPGKTLRTLSLLSGGERALVAIALYFAMVRVHPTPFCVVDEIEAALDEANSLRFVRCLEDMARDTQFLLITHRRATMEAAQMLYGVTMEQQGVSRVIRLDLDQVEAVLGETN
jgi:chromosome segregation protein